MNKSSNMNSLNGLYLLLTVLSYTCLCPAPSSFLFSCLLSHVRILHHEQAEKKNIQIMAKDEHQIHKVNVSFHSVRLITFFIQISRFCRLLPSISLMKNRDGGLVETVFGFFVFKC